ncbi:MAG: nuclear transport factor 2 family protein, partial [Cyanobacteria bacterium J06555_12]
PDLQGDYVGLEGLRRFFGALATLTDGTFTVEDKEVQYVGDELVVTLAQPMMTLDGESFETDAVVVWRIVGDRIAEAWDIPAIYSMRPQVLN